jgi:cyanate lyase
MTLSEHLTLAKTNLGLTYLDVARRTGISTHSIKPIFVGERIPDKEQLANLCAVLGIDRDQLEPIRAKAEKWNGKQWIGKKAIHEHSL